MGLYRNIAGLNPYNQVGLLLNLKDAFTPPIVPSTGGDLTITPPSSIQILPPGTTWGTGTTLQDVGQQLADIHAATAASNLSRYNYLLTTSPGDLTQQGYYVTDDGYVYVYTDAAHTTSVGYLDLGIIQDIENTAGTAGTLFMHMGLPVLAKDTAGYAGGGRASQGATTMYSTPIADVLAIPATPTGPNVIIDYNPPQPTTPTVIPGGGENTTPKPGTGVPTTTTTPTSTLVAGNTLGIVALGLAVIGVARSRKLLLVGGLGLLYYSMSKIQTHAST